MYKRQEYAGIRDTMRMRGIEASFPASLLHPLRATEFVLVPILMRCLKVADELAASAVSRGIESRASRTSVRDVRLRVRDGVAAAVLAAFVVGVLAVDAGPAGQVVVWRISL